MDTIRVNFGCLKITKTIVVINTTRINPLPDRAIIGMVHLQPLPGSPRFTGDLEAVERFAINDAKTLIAGGCHAIMIENFGDAPFHGNEVAPITIAAMSRIVSKIVDEAARLEGIPVGVNVLRNDAAAALSIASACGANFIRVNIHVGGMMTDQGLIEGKAAETLRLREQLGHGPDSNHPIAIFADVGVKHATPLDSDWMLEQEAQDCWNRGLADALIVSGSGTGQPTSPEDNARVRLATPHATLLVGSGVTSENLQDYLRHADGAIIGTSLKEGNDVSKRVDLSVVSKVIEAAKSK